MYICLFCLLLLFMFWLQLSLLPKSKEPLIQKSAIIFSAKRYWYLKWKNHHRFTTLVPWQQKISPYRSMPLPCRKVYRSTVSPGILLVERSVEKNHNCQCDAHGPMPQYTQGRRHHIARRETFPYQKPWRKYNRLFQCWTGVEYKKACSSIIGNISRMISFDISQSFTIKSDSCKILLPITR
jgi:hypothetical protein